jgi:hypothetical protein
MRLERIDTEGRGEPGGSKAHGLPGAQPFGQSYHPLDRYSRVLAVSTVVRHTKFVAVYHHRRAHDQIGLTGIGNCADKIYPEYQRRDTGHLAVRLGRKSVLKVHTGPTHLDYHVTVAELVSPPRSHGSAILAVNHICSEALRNRAHDNPLLSRESRFGRLHRCRVP